MKENHKFTKQRSGEDNALMQTRPGTNFLFGVHNNVKQSN
jgi:hypothetical protein